MAAVRLLSKKIALRKHPFLGTCALLLVCLGCSGDQPPPEDSEVDSGEVAASGRAISPTFPDSAIAVERAISGLRAVINGGQWDEKSAKIRELARYGSGARAAVPLLSELMAGDHDEHWLVRSEAVCALAAIGPEAFAELAAGLAVSDGRVRRTTAYALGKVESGSDQVVALLRDALRDNDWQVRAEAARSLANHGAKAVPEIQKALRDQDPRVRTAAAWSLRQFGPQAKVAIPDLRAALEDKNWLVRSAAVYALGRMGEDAAADLAAMTKDENWGVRSAAEEALRESGR